MWTSPVLDGTSKALSDTIYVIVTVQYSDDARPEGKHVIEAQRWADPTIIMSMDYHSVLIMAP